MYKLLTQKSRVLVRISLPILLFALLGRALFLNVSYAQAEPALVKDINDFGERLVVVLEGYL